jgi:superfamily II DNA or RNA helicase
MPDMMLREQLERRRKRGMEELTKVINRGNNPVYSTFEVTSISNQTYIVQIHSLKEQLNTCTCPDYLTNTIGTCKHIEGVLARLKKQYAGKWDALAASVPRVNRIFVHHADESSIRVTLPIPRSGKLRSLLLRYFDTEGILLGNIIESLPAFLDELSRMPQMIRERVRVDQSVHEYCANRRDVDSVEKQKQWFIDRVKEGERSLNLLSTNLYSYQEEGVLHLAFGRRVLLADDMGLGKTIQAIAAAALLKQLRDIRHVLIVSPASLKHQWAREIRRFTSLSAQVIEGNPIRRRELYRNLKFFNMINYELVRFDEKEIAKRRFDLVILDEAQRIKNWRTKTAVTVKRLRSTYAFVLTGTPLENRLDELFSIFQFIGPTILGPMWRFNQRYYKVERRPSASYRVLGHKNLDELRNRIKPYILRRLRDEVQLDLPERIDNNFFVEMTEPQINAYIEYEQVVARLMSTAQRRPLNPEEHRILLSSLIKMRLICNALALHDPEVKQHEREKTSPKLRELRSILEEEVSNNGHKAVVFSQWKQMLDLLTPLIEKLGLGWVKLSGEIPSSKRGALIDRFFSDPECRLFLSTDAGGVGLNLQAASMVINVDLPWNPAVLEQRIARAHRHGQRKSVNVINLIARGTIEERILDTLAAKRAVFDAALCEDSTVTELSFDELGQNVLQRLEVLLGTRETIQPELELQPEERTEEMRKKEAATLEDFSKLLVGRYPGRILFIGNAPTFQGAESDRKLLIVVDGEPARLRQEIEAMRNGHFEPHQAPELLLMDQESYRAFTSMAASLLSKEEPAHVFYRSSSISQPEESRVQSPIQKRLRAAAKGFDTADRRLSLASVVLEGGFPEEVMRPIRQAMGWALTSHLSLTGDRAANEKLPSPRLVETELVVPGRISVDQAARVDRVRALTTPSKEENDDEAPPPSIETAGALIDTVRELIDLGRELIAKEGL